MSGRSRARREPLYVQIADELREQIGSLGSGARIPSEPQIAKDWRVSRFTVAKAVEQLVDEGLITRRQGSGTFVAEAPLRRAPGYLLSFTEAVEAAGHEATHRLLAFEPAEWESGLPYPQDEALLRLDRLRMVDGKAVALHRSTLSRKLVDRLGLTEEIALRPTFSLYRFFEERGHSVHSASERLIACAADVEDRRLLDLNEGAVVVAVTRHSFAADGAALDAVSAIYDARRYSYESRLVRQHQTGNTPKRENQDESSSENRPDHIGPRLGPWGDQRERG